jgi:hypothetical protein
MDKNGHGKDIDANVNKKGVAARFRISNPFANFPVLIDTAHRLHRT